MSMRRQGKLPTCARLNNDAQKHNVSTRLRGRANERDLQAWQDQTYVQEYGGFNQVSHGLGTLGL